MPNKGRWTGLLLAVAGAASACAQCPAERIVAPVGWQGGSFAKRVQIEGDVAVVAEPSDHTFCPVFTCSSGAVHVFRRAAGEWSFEQTVFHSRISERDTFGGGISMDGPGRFAASTLGEDVAGDGAGAVYIFEHDGQSWREVAELLPPEPQWSNGFGLSLALRGDTLVVGAPRFHTETAAPGAAWVYRLIDGKWEFAQKLVPPDPRNGVWFGNALALDGEWLVIGAPLHDELGHLSGAVYVYRRRSDGAFDFLTKLRAPVPEDGTEFGWALAVGGSGLAVGAPNSVSTNGKGAVQVFEFDAGAWRHSDTVLHDDALDRDHLGSSVSMWEGIIVSGAPDRLLPSGSRGAAYVFHRQADGSWRQAAELVPGPDSFDFGRAVATDGASAIVGAPWESVSGLGAAGAAHIFDLGCLLCRADLDGDGALTFFDFLAFQALFAAGDMSADFDGDTALTFFDFLAFQAEFAAGCA